VSGILRSLPARQRRGSGSDADRVPLVLENGPPRTEIHLLSCQHPDPSPDTRSRDLYKIGMNHICFAVDDVAEEVAKLRAHGFNARNEIMDFPSRKLVLIDGPEAAGSARPFADAGQADQPVAHPLGRCTMIFMLMSYVITVEQGDGQM
jgi:catechol 2,3-dioxygenase-like lactoylglutathione lyase family enzyme